MPTAKANGITLEYEECGRKSDPALLLIMGFSGQLTMWPDSLCEGLASKGFHVIRFDNRDVGKSAKIENGPQVNIPDLMAKSMSGEALPPIPYHLDDMAKDAVGLLDALGIDTAHIVGASMGGMIAQIVAAKHPERTRSLVSIMSTTGKRGLPPAKPEAMAALMTPPADTKRETLINRFMTSFGVIGSPGFKATQDELRTTAERQVDRVPYYPSGVQRQLAAIVCATPRNDILRNVRAPAMVIHGADDPLVPVEGGKDTAESIAGCKLVVVPGMAHDFTNALVPIYLQHIGDFVTEVEKRRKAA
jgi:pimeloyl-ACP methyl ester carboxylesterase